MMLATFLDDASIAARVIDHPRRDTAAVGREVGRCHGQQVRMADLLGILLTVAVRVYMENAVPASRDTSCSVRTDRS